MRSLSLVAGLGLAGALPALGCASAPRCGPAASGALVRWAEIPLEPAARITLVPVVAASAPRLDASSETVLLRFDRGAFGGAGLIDRAALVLVPAPDARRDRCARLVVRAVDEPWTRAALARGDRPALSPGRAAEVLLPPQRVPVRVDVTALARALGAAGLHERGLAVTATEGGVIFQGSGTLSPLERPRLEVLLR